MSKTYQMNMGGKRVEAAGQETFDDLNSHFRRSLRAGALRRPAAHGKDVPLKA